MTYRAAANREWIMTTIEFVTKIRRLLTLYIAVTQFTYGNR